jgi:hypothetical protein
MPLVPQDFVRKWKRSTGREKQIYQQHFLDLCELVGHPTPAIYNARPTWLDQAVFVAYGWPSDLSDEEILENLLALNLERSKR